MDLLKKQQRIKAINTLCSKLKISADERHDIQREATGHASLKTMSVLDLEDVLGKLRSIERARAGEAETNSGNSWSFVFKLPTERRRLAQKLYRQAERIGARQEPPIRVMPPAYMSATARRMMGYDKPEFANVVVNIELADARILHKMVQAMEMHLGRKAG